jgi:Fe-S cluster assembly protein SufD
MDRRGDPPVSGTAAKGGAALVRSWADAFPAFAAQTSDVTWLANLREEALGSLIDLGLPHRKLEEWRYTSLAALEQSAWTPITPSDETTSETADLAQVLESLALPDVRGLRAVFVDGRFEARHSDLAGANGAFSFDRFADARSGGPGEALLRAHLGQLAGHKTDAFTALNTAFAQDGALLEIAAGAVVETPIHLVFVSRSEGKLVCPRVVVVARENSRACVVVSHVSAGADVAPVLTSSVAELYVGENAGLDWITLQRENDDALHVSNHQARLSRNARLSSHTLSLGGALVRNELDVVLAESGAEVDLRGLFLGAGGRIVDNHTLVDHAMPHCASRELYKGVLGDSARGVFRGRVLVRPDAQKTDASQSNPNLLLTDRAEIDTKPQLEIYADDVKCSHGSTIGQLDEEALFYLRARGLSERGARVLLTRGFANEICDDLPEATLSAWGQSHVADALRITIGEEPA